MQLPQTRADANASVHVSRTLDASMRRLTALDVAPLHACVSSRMPGNVLTKTP